MNPKLLWLLTAILLALVHRAEAQQPKKIARIGFLTARSSQSDQDALFKQTLRDVGWIEGQNLIIEWRGAAGKTEELPHLAAELARLPVDVIVASATPSVQAARSTTSSIPIVMSGAADPVGTGFVASLARPGGNITGVSLQSPELAGKRMELLRDVLPKLSRVAFLAYKPDPAHRFFVKEAQEAAHLLNVQIQPLVLESPEEVEDAFSMMVRERAGAVIIQPLFMRLRKSPAYYRAIGKEPDASSVRWHSIRRTGRANLLRSESIRVVSPHCQFRRQDPQGREARRSARRTANKI
jgi:putative ABC transport system substrate-binding protein